MMPPRGCSRLHRLAAVLLVAAVLLQSTTAQDAPFGAYLGCFSSDIASEKNQVTTGLEGCRAACAEKSFGILLVSTDSKCYCSNTVPSEASRLKFADCQAGGKGVATFYLHAEAATQQCKVSNPPMAEAWTIANGRADVEISAAEDAVALRLDNPSGARLEGKDGKHLYGMFQIDVKSKSEPGAVATFYTRSSSVYPNEAAGEFSEIDFEFCNARPCTPAGLWLNSYTEGKSHGERLIKMEEYQELLGSTARIDQVFTTYTINWQPESLAWAMNDTLLQARKNGETVNWLNMGGQPMTATFQSPNLPQFVVLSTWTDNRPPPDNFGGVLDLSGGPYYTYYKNHRRIICDGPLPADDTTAKGPAWLYGGTDSATESPTDNPGYVSNATARAGNVGLNANETETNTDVTASDGAVAFESAETGGDGSGSGSADGSSGGFGAGGPTVTVRRNSSTSSTAAASNNRTSGNSTAQASSSTAVRGSGVYWLSLVCLVVMLAAVGL